MSSEKISASTSVKSTGDNGDKRDIFQHNKSDLQQGYNQYQSKQRETQKTSTKIRNNNPE